MKTNIKAYELIEKGLSSKTVGKLTESQINILYSKLINEQVAGKGTTMVSSKNPNAAGIAKELNAQGVNVSVTEKKEVEEDVEVSDDPNKDVETQDPEQVGPSTDDGFGNDDDGMGMLEELDEEKKSNPWAICTSQLSREFGTSKRHLWNAKENNKYERCVKDVKQSLKEGKNPLSLFLEDEIMKIVEKNLQPRITKKDLMNYLTENELEAPVKTPVRTPVKPGTKPNTRPRHPGFNPNPGIKPAPKAVSPDNAKENIIDLIINLIEKK